MVANNVLLWDASGCAFGEGEMTFDFAEPDLLAFAGLLDEVLGARNDSMSFITRTGFEPNERFG